ncbi:hypothetical protein ACN93_09490 [Gordonia paraffinivorans]|nr:hypothetical protein ACN93_09490 [Gordonia paraffinivorans]
MWVSGVKVDPDLLRGFAGIAEGSGAAVGSCGLSEAFARVAACLPGSETAFYASAAADAVREPIRALASCYATAAAATRTAAGVYEATDDELAAGLSKIEVGPE